jgi:hypothetical protein
MRCLYCDKKLSWLRAGKGPFCSVAHEIAYNEQQTQEGLGRLLHPFGEAEQPAPPARKPASRTASKKVPPPTMEEPAPPHEAPAPEAYAGHADAEVEADAAALDAMMAFERLKSLASAASEPARAEEEVPAASAHLVWEGESPAASAPVETPPKRLPKPRALRRDPVVDPPQCGPVEQLRFNAYASAEVPNSYGAEFSEQRMPLRLPVRFALHPVPEFGGVLPRDVHPDEPALPTVPDPVSVALPVGVRDDSAVDDSMQGAGAVVVAHVPPTARHELDLRAAAHLAPPRTDPEWTEVASRFWSGAAVVGEVPVASQAAGSFIPVGKPQETRGISLEPGPPLVPERRASGVSVWQTARVACDLPVESHAAEILNPAETRPNPQSRIVVPQEAKPASLKTAIQAGTHPAAVPDPAANPAGDLRAPILHGGGTKFELETLDHYRFAPGPARGVEPATLAAPAEIESHPAFTTEPARHSLGLGKRPGIAVSWSAKQPKRSETIPAEAPLELQAKTTAAGFENRISALGRADEFTIEAGPRQPADRAGMAAEAQPADPHLRLPRIEPWRRVICGAPICPVENVTRATDPQGEQLPLGGALSIEPALREPAMAGLPAGMAAASVPTPEMTPREPWESVDLSALEIRRFHGGLHLCLPVASAAARAALRPAVASTWVPRAGETSVARAAAARVFPHLRGPRIPAGARPNETNYREYTYKNNGA